MTQLPSLQSWPQRSILDGSSQTQSTYGTEVLLVLCLHWYYIHSHVAITAACTFCDSLGTKVSFSKSYSPNNKSSLCFGERYKVTYWRTTNPQAEHNSTCRFCPPDRSVCTEGHQGFDAGIREVQKFYQRERKGRERWREREKSTNKQKKKSQNSTLCHPPLPSFLVYEQYSLKAPYESNPTTKKAQSIQICTILVSRYLKAVVPANSF